MSWLAFLFLPVALAGCFDDRGLTDAVYVQNNTDVTLHFTIILVSGRPFELSDKVAPGETYRLLSGSQLRHDEGMMVDRCTVGDLVAYDPTGREVARHPPGLCARTHDVWTIGPLGSPPPSA